MLFWERILGVCAAVAGAVALAPGAWPIMAGSLKETVRSAFGREGEHVGGIAGTASWAFSAFARGVASGGNMEDRVERLEAARLRIETELDELRNRLREQAQNLRDEAARLTSELQILRFSLDQLRQTASSVNARALPLVTVGIVLCGLPDEVARTVWAVLGGALFGILAAIWRFRAPPVPLAHTSR